MLPVKFPGVNKVYAEDQPEYTPLPVQAIPSAEGEVISCWVLSAAEFERIKETRCVYLHQWTFNQPLQPVRLEVEHTDASLYEGDPEKGQIQQKDNGEITINVSTDFEKQTVALTFGTKTLAFSRDQAVAIANELLNRAWTLTPTKKDED